jgi:2,4-dienoyl-CoA reductase-like NADH-dependent reductase (Old Yellow Enzyme family)
MTSKLFEPIRLRGLTLPNRIVVAPMCQYSAVDGSATDWHVMHWTQFALGGAGLFVMEATGVSAQGRISPTCLGLYSDENERAMSRALSAANRYGSAPMGIQLAHAGRKASTRPPGSQGMGALTPAEGAWETVSASAIPYTDTWHTPVALDRAGLERVKGEFVTAARRAVRLGLDEIELHMAHGYLLQQFLSPLSNHRDDSYGGGLENRMRFPLEVFAAVRAAMPPDKPLGARINATDWAEGGWTIEDAVIFARELKALGCDFVCVSSSGSTPAQKIPVAPLYQVPFAKRIRAETGIMTRAVGLILTPQQAEEIVADGAADMVALARGMLDDPRWAWHAAKILGADAAYPIQYRRAKFDVWPGVNPRPF